jgi:O-antigen/teichoic acid export membrane protein
LREEQVCPAVTVLNAAPLPTEIQVTVKKSTTGLGMSERVRLLRDSALNCSGVVVSGLVALIVVPILLHGLGADVYGCWIAALSLAGALGVLDLGLDYSLTRAVARADGAGDRGEVAAFVSSAAGIYLAAGIIGGLGIALAGVPLSRLLGTSAIREIVPAIFWACGFAFAANHLLKFATATLEGLRRFDIANALAVAGAVLRSGGMAVLVLSGARVAVAAGWYAIAAWIVAGVSLLTVGRLEPRFCSPRFSWRPLKAQMTFAFANQISMALNKVVWESAPIIVGAIAGPAAIVTLYIGQKFPIVLSTITSQAAGVLLAVASKEQGRESRFALLHVLEFGTRLTVLIALGAGLALYLLAPAILTVWIGGLVSSSVTVMRITLVAVIADVLGIAAIQVLWARGEIRQLLSLHMIMAAITLVSIVPFIHVGGASGAAMALALSLTVGSILSLRFAAVSCGGEFTRVVAQAVEGLGGPVLACAGIVLGLMSFVQSSWLWIGGLIVVSIAVYAATLILLGARAEEKALMRFAWQTALARASQLGRKESS